MWFARDFEAGPCGQGRRRTVADKKLEGQNQMQRGLRAAHLAAAPPGAQKALIREHPRPLLQNLCPDKLEEVEYNLLQWDSVALLELLHSPERLRWAVVRSAHPPPPVAHPATVIDSMSVGETRAHIGSRPSRWKAALLLPRLRAPRTS